MQREFILAWHAAFPDDELILALRRGTIADDIPGDVSVVHTALWPHALANRLELPRLARRARADITIAHNYTPRSGASLVFVHDAMFVDHPDWFSRRERLYFAPMLPWARRADVVTTSTLTEAQRIARLAPRVASPHAVGLGVPQALARASQHRPASVPPDARFAVTVGRLNVRKNLVSVMRGAREAHSITTETPLYIVGGTAHSGVGAEPPEDLHRAVEEGQIVFLGALLDEEVAWMYANAALVVSLSLDEGFGLPAIEAASFGAPLLVSDIPVFRETVGRYASFVSPHAPAEEVGTAMDAAWNRRPAAARQKEIAERYSWAGSVTRLRNALAAGDRATVTQPAHETPPRGQ